MIVFGTLFIGYACYAYNRKSVSAAMPQLIAEGLDKSQAGEFSCFKKWKQKSVTLESLT